MQAGNPAAMRLTGAIETASQRSASPVASATAAPRLALRRAPLSAEALAGLFPDFAIEENRRQSSGAVIGAWAGMPGSERRRSRAASLDLPFAMLGEGLLRPAPGAGRPGPCLSALALEIAGPVSPADELSPARLLARRGWESPALSARAAATREALVGARIGGSWWQTAGGSALPRRSYVLVVVTEPPVAGSGRNIDSAALTQMIDAALTENRPERVVVLADDRRYGLQRSSLAAAAERGALVLTVPVNPWAALERAERVYSGGGEIGFLALLAGLGVRCFGPSFYAGWGLTEDEPAVPQQAFARSFDEIFAGSCLVATRYLDPFRNAPASFEDTLALLTDWRRIEESNRRIAVCVGMSFWKQCRVADFLASSAGAPVFRRSARAAVSAALGTAGAPPRAIAVWASRIPAGLPEAAARRGIPLIRVEDGFVRSVGLGADFLPPASLVFDAGGMYYDPRTQSDLESLLRDAEFTSALIERACRLIAQLVRRGVTKYNLAGDMPEIEIPPGKRSILVPGQVEDDLSVVYGGGEIRGNLSLLQAVRCDNPDAFILYKPHPDVLAGHRKGAVPEAGARQFADTAVKNVSTAVLLDRVDEVHTMTSLAGFEALLRRRRVVVHGRPFYAGWGLTEDRRPFDRGRKLGLEELVAGALILYPRYLDPVTRLPCGPEVIIKRLERPELWRAGMLVRARRLQGALARRLREFRAQSR
jgi:capsular polysaccharide export protein